MSQPSLSTREVAVVRDLVMLSADRAGSEAKVASRLARQSESARREYQAGVEGLNQSARLERETTEQEYAAARRGAVDAASRQATATREEFEAYNRKIAAGLEAGKEEAQKARDEARWQALAVYEADTDGAKKQFEELQAALAAEFEVFGPFEPAANALLARHARLASGAPAELSGPAPIPPETSCEQLLASFTDRINAADAAYDALARLTLPKLVGWAAYPWPWLLLGLALAIPGYMALGWPAGPIAAVVGSLALGLAVRPWLVGIARRQVERTHPPLARAVAEASAFGKRCREQAVVRYKARREEAERTREQRAQAAEEELARRLEELGRKAEQAARRGEETFPPRLAEIERRRALAVAQAEQDFPPRLAAIETRLDADLKRLDAEYQQLTERIQRDHREAWDAMAAAWADGLARITGEVAAINDTVGRFSFDWANQPPEAWAPQAEVPPALRFGQFPVAMAAIPDGIPRDDRLREMTPASLTMPALLPFPERGSMLIKAVDDGRDRAVEAVKAVMLRYLTSVPPAKVRFTIIDPVGLGRNFAAFMHLADFDEQLVTSRIWTETRHIEQRLADLTEHMENVIQKYLRDEYPTIEEYNAMAGEVAEPFRVVVVANFPANFSEAAARRLISIAAGGARCGVQTLVTVDTRLPMPQGIQLRDLEQHATVLAWNGETFRWQGSDLGTYPLTLDAPPPPETLTRLVQRTGEAARQAKRVEVPFDYIAPPAENWWTGDSRSGIDVPLGRAGATRLQHLKLGKGTAQHVLIAGRTGSGKSTLLHALITNASLIYGPDELELYLIDFKKGVEFKTYATHELPHARVVAIESEREFGLSVLQRLDAELKRRGDLYREVGAQDVASFRAAGGQPMPRILLIVDEFQEFFVEDDKLAQEVALLLDRLVRQGRAFGIHVHLGSQSLGGAYSLARSTLGQMAVRIALQCSESDAHLILSEDNAAARLLSRPGEAIYNDANGLLEGNHLFQVVWLSDERREDYLKRLRALAVERRYAPDRPAIVFEGNTPADLTINPLLASRLAEPPTEAPRAAYAWLGDAIAIKDPTAAVFRRQGGSNLLLLGQQEEAALGILASAMIGLAAQHPAESARFVILDGTPADSLHAGSLEKVAEALPLQADFHAARETGAALTALAEEIARRREAEESGETLASPSIYLLIHDLSRFRDLRKAEDDYGYGRYGEDKPVSPAQQLVTVLREGPAVGVHALVWCDTLSNANRAFDRQTLREFEMRVLFQMSGNDSSNLIDAPTASRLGLHRALFHDEEKGILEKFRPYALPGDDWLDLVRDRLKAVPR